MNNETIIQTLNMLDKNEIIQLICSFLKNHPESRDDFCELLHPLTREEQKFRSAIAHLEQITEEFERKDAEAMRDLDYWGLENVKAPLEEFEDEFIGAYESFFDHLIEENLLDQAIEYFKKALFILEKVESVELEHIIPDVYQAIEDTTRKIEPLLSLQQRKALFDWMIEQVEGRLFVIFGFENWFYEGFQRDEELLAKAELLERMIDDDTSRMLGFMHQQDIAARLIQLYQQLGMDESRSMNLIERLDFPLSLLRLHASWLEKQDRKEEAEKLLEEAEEEIEHEDVNNVRIRSLPMLQLLHTLGEGELYKEMAKNYLFNLRQANLDVIHQLKEFCTEEEWKEMLGPLKDLMKNSSRYIPFLAGEGLLDELKTEIDKAVLPLRDEYLDAYGPLLGSEDALWLGTKYLERASRKAFQATSVQDYEKVAQDLKKAALQPELTEQVESILERMYKAYSRKGSYLEVFGRENLIREN